MKICFRKMMGAAALGATLLLVSIDPEQALAQGAPEPDAASLKAEIDALKRLDRQYASIERI